MVTAGVYMIGRNAVLFGHAPETLQIVAVIGVVTAFVAGTIGLVQNDIKRVLAYSTVSQLGYMFLGMGVGAYTAGVFHLYTHAFFKALMFLGSGAVIHALAGEQDMRRMGGLKSELPVTYWTFLIGALAIAGVPLLSGFFSKDEILYRTYATGHTWLWLLGMITSLLTAIYMFRLVFMTFHGKRAPAVVAAEDAAAHDHGHGGHGHAAHGHGAHGHHLHDAPKPMAFALLVLALGSVLAGYVGVPHALGGSNRIEQFLEPSFTVSEGVERGPGAVQQAGSPVETGSLAAAEEGEHPPGEGAGLELTLMLVSSLVAVGGIGIAFVVFLKNPSAADAIAARFAGLRTLLANKYYVDEVYDATIVQPIKITSEQGLWKVVDAKLIDGTVNGVAESVGGLSELLRRVQTGSVRTYAASLFLGVVLTLGYYLWR
jgi:NADH-quinone oxidoreductase subunit L